MKRVEFVPKSTPRTAGGRALDRARLTCCVALLACAGVAGAEVNVDLGRPFSAAASIPPNDLSAVLVQLAENRVLVVTQYCKSGGEFGADLAASAFGVIPSGSAHCQSYEPGVVLQGGQSVSCSLSFPVEWEASHCLINGYVRTVR